MGYENNEKKMDSVFSIRIKAGKRRTYFFDIKSTKANDYFLTITESRRRFNEEGYERHKIFLYKEDFNKFLKGLTEAVDYVKTDLMPDYDFDAFNHEYPEQEEGEGIPIPIFPVNGKEVFEEIIIGAPVEDLPLVKKEILAETLSFRNSYTEEEVDKW